jgi:hypothetical protein
MGAVLHEMLTGEKLFEAAGAAFAVMRAHVEAEPAAPSSRNPKVPAALDDDCAEGGGKGSGDAVPIGGRIPVRVTGGEREPAPMPAPVARFRPLAEAPEPSVAKTDSVAAPVETASPVVPAPAPQSAAALPDAASQKAQNGNRFVRALGKVNPFRKRTKYVEGEAVQAPSQQQ